MNEQTGYHSKLHDILLKASRFRETNDKELFEKYIERAKKRVGLSRRCKPIGNITQEEEEGDAPLEIKFKQDLCLPLHIAVRHTLSAPYSLVESMVMAYPEALEIPYMGDLPLHIACNPRDNAFQARKIRKGSEQELIIDYLMEQSPRCIFGVEGDESEGTTALHLLLEHQPNVDLVKRMLTKAATVESDVPLVKMTDCQGQLPLHVAIQYHASDDVVDLLCEKYAGAVRHRVNEGSLPIHLAALWGCTPRTLHKLLVSFPESVVESCVKDIKGQTALQLIFDNMSRWGETGKKEKQKFGLLSEEQMLEQMLRAYARHVHHRMGGGRRTKHLVLETVASTLRKKNAYGTSLLDSVKSCSVEYDVPKSLLQFFMKVSACRVNLLAEDEVRDVDSSHSPSRKKRRDFFGTERHQNKRRRLFQRS